MKKNLAIETIKSFINNSDNDIMKDAIITLHPELAESKDEWIRKAIKCYVEDMPDTYGFANGIGKKEMLSYLEKQKEQKPVECIPDTANFDEGFKTGREVGFREGVESVKPVDWSSIGECPKEDEYESIENGNATGWRRKQKTPHFNTYEEFCEYYKDFHVCSRELFEMGARNVGAPKMKSQSEIPSTQWSEEDTYMINVLECIVARYRPDEIFQLGNKNVSAYKICSWLRLKLLRSSWKPSKEQLDALKEASASWMNQEMGNCELLESLYNDLKKLI